MVRFEREVIAQGQYSLNAPNEFFLAEGFKIAMSTVLPALGQRYWGTILSPKGRFIGSDNPVMLDGPKGATVGFESADHIIFPLNRFLLLVGTTQRVQPPAVNLKKIARHNTFTMVRAAEQVYSHIPDFCWLDEALKVQTNWEMFSRSRVLESD
jgi:hypothetical protein